MIKITRSLPVCLDQILHFDVYKSALEQTLSLEPPMADFLKSREGIKMWLNRLETLETFRYWAEKIAYEMLRLIGDSPITYIDSLTFVASNETVTSHIDSVLKDIQRASEEEAMEFEELISEINALTTNN